jgi:hypothetical protein
MGTSFYNPFLSSDTVYVQEICDLLLAAGYFRARIRGLSPFDKVPTIILTDSQEKYTSKMP